MKSALSALFAVALLAGGAGCCHRCCRQGLLARDCSNGGCGPRFRFSWSRCRDTCDQCGNWTGAPVVARQSWQNVAYAENLGQDDPRPCRGLRCGRFAARRQAYREYDQGYDTETTHEMDHDVVVDDPRMMRRSGRPTLARVSGRPTPVMMDDESVADEMPVNERVVRRAGRPTLARVSGQPTPAMVDGESDADAIPSAPRSTKAKRVSRKQAAPSRRPELSQE
jgi:hypothetical protein